MKKNIIYLSLTLLALNLSLLNSSGRAMEVDEIREPDPHTPTKSLMMTPLTRSPLGTRDLNCDEGSPTPFKGSLTPSKRKSPNAGRGDLRGVGKSSVKAVKVDLEDPDGATGNVGREVDPRAVRIGESGTILFPSLTEVVVETGERRGAILETQAAQRVASLSEVDRNREAVARIAKVWRSFRLIASAKRELRDLRRQRKLTERIRVSRETTSQGVRIESTDLNLFGRPLTIPTGVVFLPTTEISEIFDDQYRLINAAREAAEVRAKASKAAGGEIVKSQPGHIVPSRRALREAVTHHLGSAFLSSRTGSTRLLVTVDINDYMMVFSEGAMIKIEGESVVRSNFRDFSGALTRVLGSSSGPGVSNTLMGFKDVREFLLPEAVDAVVDTRNLGSLLGIFEQHTQLITETLSSQKYGALITQRIYDKVLKPEYRLKSPITAEETKKVKQAHARLSAALVEWHSQQTAFGSICMLGAGAGNAAAASDFCDFPRQLLEMILIGDFRLTIGDRSVPVTFETITSHSETINEGTGLQARVKEKMYILKCNALIGNPEEDPYACTSPFAIALHGKQPDAVAGPTAMQAAQPKKSWWKFW